MSSAAPTTRSAARPWRDRRSRTTDSRPGSRLGRSGSCSATPTGWPGCSPDALVGDAGGLELKCPSPGNHLIWWLHGRATGEIPKKHMPQVQFSLWVTGRKWWDWMSSTRILPPFLARVAPDPPANGPRGNGARCTHMPAVYEFEIRAGRALLTAEGFGPTMEEAA